VAKYRLAPREFGLGVCCENIPWRHVTVIGWPAEYSESKPKTMHFATKLADESALILRD